LKAVGNVERHGCRRRKEGIASFVKSRAKPMSTPGVRVGLRGRTAYAEGEEIKRGKKASTSQGRRKEQHVTNRANEKR